MKKLFILLTASLLLLGFTAMIADDDPFSALLKKLEEYRKKYPQEKLHLHLDKPYYAVGDDIWFKAYVVNSETSGPSDISNILYVELIDEKDAIIKQHKLALQNGITWGDFELADSLNEGNYRIRAYTQWMRNAGPDFFFDKTVKIGNAWSNKVFYTANYQYENGNEGEKLNSTIQFKDANNMPYATNQVSYDVQLRSQSLLKGNAITNKNGEINLSIANAQPDLYNWGSIIATLTLPKNQKVIKTIPIKAISHATDVQFFPEGGNLIQDVPGKIAVKAIHSNGLGENIKGTVVDNDGLEIINFETTHLGMGAYYLNPAPGKSYTAKVKFADGSERSINLPKVQKAGYALSVNNTDTEKVTLKVMISPELLNKGELKLVAQKSGKVYFANKINTTKQITISNISKKDFPSGILHLTLFSPENIPVCERLVFIDNPTDKINLDVQNLAASYSKRAPLDLNLIATNNGKPVQGSFSIAVTNNASVAPDPENESNILTSLLLTSDLIGFVEKPNYYFLNNDLKTRSNLDNLLLTQGWRRTIWQKIISNDMPPIHYAPEKSLTISGTITHAGKPVPNAKVILFSSSQRLFMIDTLSDLAGHFSFDRLQFKDNTHFVIQARTDKDNKNTKIDLDVTPAQIVNRNKNIADVEVNVNGVMANYLKLSNSYFNSLPNKAGNGTIQIEEVNIQSEKKKKLINSANLNGPGNADVVFQAEDLVYAFSLVSYLQGRVAGLNFQNGVPYLSRSIGDLYGPSPMQIRVDGMTISAESLDDISPLDIESVEVLKSAALTSIYNATGGVLLITTKRGQKNYAYNRVTPGLITYMPKGYYINRLFYSPKYDVKTDDKPDLRTTLFWNPHLISDQQGKINIQYYNADNPGTYRMVIEGIDADGNLARKTLTYTVK